MILCDISAEFQSQVDYNKDHYVIVQSLSNTFDLLSRISEVFNEMEMEINIVVNKIFAKIYLKIRLRGKEIS